LAISFDDPDVFVDGAVGGPDFDGAEVHGDQYHDGNGGSQGENWENLASCL
jgi:hypothetical protein